MSLEWIIEISMPMVGMRKGSASMHSSQDDVRGRVNMIAALCKQNLIAPFTVEGACNRTVFETWLESCLLPTLEAGQVVVLDNAMFHKGGRIEQLIEDAGCKLLYLPPYSPDLNKIEQCWSWLKSRIRKKLEQFDCLRDAIEYVLRCVS
jgi:transposase